MSVLCEQTYKANTPGYIISWLVLGPPELGTEQLSERIANQNDGIDSEFLDDLIN
jgi:hypothetical protein